VFSTINNTYWFFNTAGELLFGGSATDPVTKIPFMGTWLESGGLLSPLRLEGDPFPEGGPDAVVYRSGYTNLTDAGQKLLHITAQGPGIDLQNDDFWFVVEPDGSRRLIVRERDPVPGGSPGQVFGTPSFPGVEHLNADGTVIMDAWVVDLGPPPTTPYKGLWIDQNGNLTLVARSGDPAPGIPDAVFDDNVTSSAKLGGGARIVMTATLSGPGVDSSNNLGAWVWNEDSFELLLRKGDQAPGAPLGATFKSIIAGPNAAGLTLIHGWLDGTGIVPGTNDEGAWMADAQGQLTPIIRKGEPFVLDPNATDPDIRTVAIFSIGASIGESGLLCTFNAAGEVTLIVRFTDGSEGVFVASLPPNTPEGVNVEVAPAPDVLMTFDTVTTAGMTTVQTGSAGALPPTGFILGTPPTFYDISTTATFSGSVEICFDYSNVSYSNESSLKLLHDDGNGWQDVTSSLDTTNDIICGVVSSLSPFIVVEKNIVPAVSDWGLVTMVLIMLSAGSLVLMRRRTAWR